MLRKAKRGIKRDLNIVNLIVKLQEFDKFKRIFLSDEQRMIFDNLPRPLILFDKSSKGSSQNPKAMDTYTNNYYDQPRGAQKAVKDLL